MSVNYKMNLFHQHQRMEVQNQKRQQRKQDREKIGPRKRKKNRRGKEGFSML